MHLQILATLGSSAWISSAACKIRSMLVVCASDGGTAPAMPLGVLAWPWPAFRSCSLVSVARTSLPQFSRTLAMTVMAWLQRHRSRWSKSKKLLLLFFTNLKSMNEWITRWCHSFFPISRTLSSLDNYYAGVCVCGVFVWVRRIWHDLKKGVLDWRFYFYFIA